MIGRELGPTWSSLREGDALFSKSSAFWVVIFVLEDAPNDQNESTRVFRVLDDKPSLGLISGHHRIRADNAEIDLTRWEVIRYNATT